MANGKSKSSWNNLYIIFIYVGFFGIAIFIAKIIRRYRNRLRLEAGNQLPVRSRRGMDAEEIESLPSLRFSEIKLHKVAEEGQIECSVCLSEFKDQEMLRLLPDCLHVFHPDCIAPWLRSHVTCPVCRASLSLDQRQGSSLTTSSVLERLSGALSSDIYERSQSNVDRRIIDEGDLESTVEIEETVALDGAHEDLGDTGGVRPLVRRFSTGDLAIKFVSENDRTNNTIDAGAVNENLSESIRFSDVSWKSDNVVNYDSLIFMHLKGNT